MTPDKQRRLVFFGLAASLLLNVFLLGFGAARWFSPRPNRYGRVPHRARTPAMRAVFAARRPQLRAQRHKIHDARSAVRDALLAEPFDPDPLKTALAELREATGQAQEALHNALIEVAPGLTRGERAQLSQAHRLWSGRHRRPPHRRPPLPPPEE